MHETVSPVGSCPPALGPVGVLALLPACVIWVGDGEKPGPDTTPPTGPVTIVPDPGDDTGTDPTTTTTTDDTGGTTVTPARTLSECVASGEMLTETWRAWFLGAHPTDRVVLADGWVVLAGAGNAGVYRAVGDVSRPADLESRYALAVTGRVRDVDLDVATDQGFLLTEDGAVWAWRPSDGLVLGEGEAPDAVALDAMGGGATMATGGGWATWAVGAETNTWGGLLDEATALDWSGYLALAGLRDGAPTLHLVSPFLPEEAQATWTASFDWKEGDAPTGVVWGAGRVAVATGPQPYSTVAVLSDHDLAVVSESTYEGLGVARMDSAGSDWFWGVGDTWLTAFAWSDGRYALAAELDSPANDVAVDPEDRFLLTGHDDATVRRWGCE